MDKIRTEIVLSTKSSILYYFIVHVRTHSRVNTSAVALGAVDSVHPPRRHPSTRTCWSRRVVLSMRLVHVQLGSHYCGLASDPELRAVTAQEANKRARHVTKRQS
jgi:hypothetical protein